MRKTFIEKYRELLSKQKTEDSEGDIFEDVGMAIIVIGIFTLLWNFVMPPVFGVSQITYLQSLALLIMIHGMKHFLKA